MSCVSSEQQTHRTHSIHRKSTLLVAQILPATPRFADTIACFSGPNINASSTVTAAATTSASITSTAVNAANECSLNEESHELLDYYPRDSIGNSGSAASANFDPADFKLDALDFSLTRRLLGAVFFLLIIYAWKQYIDDDEGSDFIYI